jgi:hypothetical protein
MPFPVVTEEAWREPAAALTSLVEYVETSVQEAADWYLRDKRMKSLLSQGLRALAIALAAAGGVFPLVDAVTPGRESSGWGYVFLALAAACVAFDRFFGLSSAWMRDMTTAQAIQRRLETFRFDWAAECIHGVRGQDTEHIMRMLVMIRRFAEDVDNYVHHETSDWVIEFQHNLTQLEHRAGHDWGTSGDRRHPPHQEIAGPSTNQGESARPTEPGESADRA